MKRIRRGHMAGGIDNVCTDRPLLLHSRLPSLFWPNILLNLTYNTIISCSKSKDPICSVGEAVVTGLAKDLFNKWRTMYVDNWYSSVDLAESVLKKRMNLVGTLRKIEKLTPKLSLLKNWRRVKLWPNRMRLAWWCWSGSTKEKFWWFLRCTMMREPIMASQL